MKYIRNIVIAFFLAIPISSLFIADTVEAETFRLGVWNIERLSPTANRGFPELKGNSKLGPRSSADLEKIADHIKNDLKVDAIIITEIEADEGTTMPRSSQLDFIKASLGSNWDYVLGRTGGKLRIGILFNNNKIRLKKSGELEATPFKVQDKEIFDRDPFIAWVSLISNNGDQLEDIIIVGLHLKSGQYNIHNHMAAVAKLLGDMKFFKQENNIPSGERDIIVMGDLNDSSHKKNNFNFIFDYFEGLGAAHMGSDLNPYPSTRVNGSQIDHIIVSNSLKGDVVEESFEVHKITSMNLDQYRKIFSDHFPLTIELNVN